MPYERAHLREKKTFQYKHTISMAYSYDKNKGIQIKKLQYKYKRKIKNIRRSCIFRFVVFMMLQWPRARGTADGFISLSIETNQIESLIYIVAHTISNSNPFWSQVFLESSRYVYFYCCRSIQFFLLRNIYFLISNPWI